MKIIKAYRLGHDDTVSYIIPSKRKAYDQMDRTWGKVYDLRERREIEGGIPSPWQKTEQ